MTSSDSSPCNSYWRGGNIHFNVNGVQERVLSRGFRDFKYCVPLDEIDIKNDQFQFESSSTDGVCITNLLVNGKQMLVGKNKDQPSFWIDGNQNECDSFMSTKQIMIQNGRIVWSECTGMMNALKFVHLQKLYNCTF